MAETVAKSTGRSLNTTTLGAFGVSAAIHAIIFLAVGSVVVFESPLVTEFFTSDDIGSYEAKQEMEIEPVLLEEQQPLPEFATVDSVTPEGGDIEDEAATPADLIISSVPAPTTSAFALPRNVGSPSGKLFGRRSSGDGDGIWDGGKRLPPPFSARPSNPAALELFSIFPGPPTLTSIKRLRKSIRASPPPTWYW